MPKKIKIQVTVRTREVKKGGKETIKRNLSEGKTVLQKLSSQQIPDCKNRHCGLVSEDLINDMAFTNIEAGEETNGTDSRNEKEVNNGGDNEKCHRRRELDEVKNRNDNIIITDRTKENTFYGFMEMDHEQT
ncbi:hypothetical protein CHS0354_021626 [Potamilus streckersoni]|uniref:Uncharacterized protein n=1 Tax=Potamilus streckersoni TaxID=2493646 RepID=A0AAE0SPX3_9BIVA|nr:hypothetical protein CHS0354_021626 [Potamilus streckersoni]